MVPYVVPFVLYLGLTQIPMAFPEQYGWLYPAVILVAGAATVFLLRGKSLLKPKWDVWPGVVVGLVGIALWIAMCHLHLEQQFTPCLPSWLRPKPRTGFNPFESIGQPLAVAGFLAARFAGLVLLVPVAEELFWRGFLLRWLIGSDWEKEPLGRFTPFSFAGVTLLFTLAHPEWLAAAVWCALLNGLIYWKRDLWNCVVAHGVSNLVLAVYIVLTGTWELW